MWKWPRHGAFMRCLLAAAVFVLAPAAFGQQTYVTRYDLYAGYAFLDSPHINLSEHGFQTQIGIRPRTWYSLGFDYSFSQGDLKITPDLLPTALQQSLGQQLAQLAALGRLHAVRAGLVHDPQLRGGTATGLPAFPQGHALCPPIVGRDSGKRRAK